ncbi:MAG: glucosamine-6-phosphate deaminase [Bacteroidetes bacterium]|nr:glucosamine-6-phosphate deaminase [Bacteroidota bacterium]MBS1540203.1 glucosamine-6-phosphate deaminase [Bacteroidota bacterium]
MNCSVHSDYHQMSEFAANEILSVLAANPKATLCLATGDTPLLTYQLLVEKIIRQKIKISQIHFVGLDEWVGVPHTNPGSCHYFLHKNIFTPLNVNLKNIHLFDALSANLADECKKMNELIDRLQGIDLMLVGIGRNGHIGFNEPGDAENNFAHISQLDPLTIEVGQKYFTETIHLQKGLTLGLAHFYAARKVMMMANGIKKKEIVKKTLEYPISTQVPATLIRKHQNAILIIDKDASGQE